MKNENKVVKVADKGITGIIVFGLAVISSLAIVGIGSLIGSLTGCPEIAKITLFVGCVYGFAISVLAVPFVAEHLKF